MEGNRLQDMRQALPAPGTADASGVSPPMPRMITEQAGAARPGGMAGAGETTKAEAAIGQSSTHPMESDHLQEMRQALLAPRAAGMTGTGGTKEAKPAIVPSSTHPMEWDCLQDMRQALPAPGAPDASAVSSLQLT